MHSTCEIKGCSEEAAFSVGSHFFCKTHQEKINGRLLSIKNSDIETSHHLDGSTLENILENYHNIKLEKEDGNDDSNEEKDTSEDQ